MSEDLTLSIALIIFGAVLVSERLLTGWLKLGNSLRPFLKIPINKTTLCIGKIIGIFGIIMGALGILQHLV